MSKIVVVKNPSQEKLQELGVSGWDIWEKEVSRFPINFSSTECAYVLEGEILVTPKGGSRYASSPVTWLPSTAVLIASGKSSSRCASTTATLSPTASDRRS